MPIQNTLHEKGDHCTIYFSIQLYVTEHINASSMSPFLQLGAGLQGYISMMAAKSRGMLYLVCNRTKPVGRSSLTVVLFYVFK